MSAAATVEAAAIAAPIAAPEQKGVASIRIELGRRGGVVDLDVARRLTHGPGSTLAAGLLRCRRRGVSG